MEIDARKFRTALGNFPTGVTIVSTIDDAGTPIALTVSSFASVSLEPPLVLWSLMRSSPFFPVFESAERFAINVLSDDQGGLSNHFAGPNEHRFAGIGTRPGLGGVPLFANCAAWFECRLWARYDGGDHQILVGEVERFATSGRPPLVFARGKYETLGPEQPGEVSDDVWPFHVAGDPVGGEYEQ